MEKDKKYRYGHIYHCNGKYLLRKVFMHQLIFFPLKKRCEKKKKANQETMININWKTLFCAIQRHIRRTVYQPHEP